MDEEIKLRMGMDSTGVETALRSMDRKIKDFGHGIKNQFHEVGKELLGALSIGSAIATIESAFQRVQAIKRQSETTGASTNFIQDIQNVGRASGIAAENVDKMLNKFIGTLKPGQDVEEEFYKMADNIAAIEDPVSRAAAAIDVFGEKMGPRFISLLAKGSAGIKQMAGEWSKFSKEEIEDLENAHIQIEKTANSIQIRTAQLINLVAIAARYFGARSSGMSPDQAMAHIVGMATGEKDDKSGRAAAAKAYEDKQSLEALKEYKGHLDSIALKSKKTSADEKIAILERIKAYDLHQAELEKGEAARYKILETVADIEDEIKNIKQDQIDKIQEQIQKEEELRLRQETKVSNLQSNYAEARKAPYEHTLEDLANQPGTFHTMGGYRFGPGVLQARQILNLRQQATQAGLSGNYERADALRKQADSSFDDLAKGDPYLKNPNASMGKNIEKQTQILNDIYENGLTVYGGDD